MTTALDDPQIFASMAELQHLIAEHMLSYRAEIARQLRADADEYELRALRVPDSQVKELEWIAYGLRVAAAKVDPA